tara:strand:- start:1809 stop:2150 length:342 start_codon:yes stop_codon:yes gene_type:complete
MSNGYIGRAPNGTGSYWFPEGGVASLESHYQRRITSDGYPKWNRKFHDAVPTTNVGTMVTEDTLNARTGDSIGSTAFTTDTKKLCIADGNDYWIKTRDEAYVEEVTPTSSWPL